MKENGNIEMRKTPEDILQDGHLKQMPFRVPTGYFEELEESVREKVTGNAPDGRWGAVRRSLKAYLGLAAAFVLLIGATYGVLKLTHGIGEKNLVARQSVDAVTLLDSLENEYVSGQLEDAAAATDSDSLSISVVPPGTSESDSSYAETDGEIIEQYLLSSPSPASSLAALETVVYQEY